VTVVYSKRISNNGKRFLTPFLNILNPWNALWDLLIQITHLIL
jgi:hypothetical protein